MLITTAMRPSGRAALGQLATSNSTTTFKDARINTFSEIARVAAEGGPIDDAITVPEIYHVNPQDGTESVDITVNIDTVAVQLVNPDRTGTTTVAHEAHHAQELGAGKDPRAIKATDKPGGPADRFGKSVGKERPDISREQAEKLVDEWVEEDQ